MHAEHFLEMKLMTLLPSLVLQLPCFLLHRYRWVVGPAPQPCAPFLLLSWPLTCNSTCVDLGSLTTIDDLKDRNRNDDDKAVRCL